MKTVIRLYTPERKTVLEKKQFKKVAMTEEPAKSFALICFVVLNLFLGLCSGPIIMLIENGLSMFA